MDSDKLASGAAAAGSLDIILDSKSSSPLPVLLDDTERSFIVSVDEDEDDFNSEVVVSEASEDSEGAIAAEDEAAPSLPSKSNSSPDLEPISTERQHSPVYDNDVVLQVGWENRY